MLRNRPWCNIKAQQENLLLKRELWDWLECAVIDRRWVCFKRDTQAFTARLRFQISQRKCFEMCRDARKYCCLFKTPGAFLIRYLFLYISAYEKMERLMRYSKSFDKSQAIKCRHEQNIKTITAHLPSFISLEILPKQMSHCCPARIIETGHCVSRPIIVKTCIFEWSATFENSQS